MTTLETIAPERLTNTIGGLFTVYDVGGNAVVRDVLDKHLDFYGRKLGKPVQYQLNIGPTRR
jgi:hypothetical protein